MRTDCTCEDGATPMGAVTVPTKRLFLLTGLSLFMLIAGGRGADAGRTEPVADAGAAQKLPMLLDLGAHKCIPCKKMAPILDELTKEYKDVFRVEFIDVWQPENVKKAKAHSIRSIPTQIFFDAGGKELWRHEGFMSKEDILKKWHELGVARPATGEHADRGKTATPESK